jgi:lipopolysaccharide O-acetyltransferase
MVSRVVNPLRRILGSLREKGLYVFAISHIDRLFGSMRNRLIARKLGVAKINIGPRSCLQGLPFIEMGEDFAAAGSLWLLAFAQHNDQKFSPKIVIGNHVRISRQVQISATHYVEIGDNVLIGSGVLITDHNHGQYSEEHSSPYVAPAMRPLDQNRRVVIGKNVWLGAGVVVTPDSFIGEGTIIGANSVVKGNIPRFTVAVGLPAKVIKTFDFDTQKWISVK